MIGRLLRTVWYLKFGQIWYQIWRRVQRRLETHPKCSDVELPEFTFLNASVKPKGWNDPRLDMLWRYNLHYFDCLASKRTGAEKMVERWVAENPKGSVPGWDPYPTSLRIVNWVKWMEFGRNDCIVDSLKNQLDWLEQHIEWHILANHLLANLKALVIGNKFLGRDNSKWMRLYKEQIAEQVLLDGGHYERSVMYHAIILEDVLDVIKFCGEDATWLKSVAEKMLRYLVNMTGPDGKISMFNDAADGIAKSTDWICDYAKQQGIAIPEVEQFVDFPVTGYTRMSAGDFVLFADTAPIGPDYQPGHAHADTLTYELYYRGKKVVTDSGTSEYRGRRRAFERSTAAHNVVEVGGCNSSEVWGSHRVGGRARIVKREVEPGRIFAAHDGYGKLVARSFELSAEGLTVFDKCPERVKCVSRVHLGCDSSAYVDSDILAFNGFAGREEFSYAAGFGKLKKGVCLFTCFDGGSAVYSIKRKSKK